MDTLLSPRRRQLLQALGAAALATGCGDPSPATRNAPTVMRFGGDTMGSTYSVKLAGQGRSPAIAAARAAAHRGRVRGRRREDVDLRRCGELSRFNRHPARAPFALSDETFAVFARAAEVSAASDGAFDITVAPAVDAWGFGPAKAQRVVDGRSVAALQGRVGWQRLALDARARTVAKAMPDVRADLSGIAKGYGVDRAAEARRGARDRRLHDRGRRRGSHARAQRERPAVADRGRAAGRGPAARAPDRAACRDSRWRPPATTGSTSSRTARATATRSIPRPAVPSRTGSRR